MSNDQELHIAHEPTTAHDVTIQAQIIEVHQRLRADKVDGLVLITHDLGVVAGMADRIAVMYAGRVVERGGVEETFREPRHPYTQGLLESLPKLDGRIGRLQAIDGAPPSLAARPSGCAFHPRCPHAIDRCRVEEPVLRPVGKTETACHLADALGQRRRPRPMEASDASVG
jgi:oligopeptide/dipeptide ABC transporter ATP-binding protein